MNISKGIALPSSHRRGKTKETRKSTISEPPPLTITKKIKYVTTSPGLPYYYTLGSYCGASWKLIRIYAGVLKSLSRDTCDHDTVCRATCVCARATTRHIFSVCVLFSFSFSLRRRTCYNFIFISRPPLGHYDARVSRCVSLRARVYLRRAFKRYAGVWPLLCSGISAHWSVNLGLPRNFYRGLRVNAVRRAYLARNAMLEQRVSTRKY